jgi:hypothetical protein
MKSKISFWRFVRSRSKFVLLGMPGGVAFEHLFAG